MFKYEVLEDNGGGLHIAIFNEEECIYFTSGFEYSHGTLKDTILFIEHESLDIDDILAMDGNSDTPQKDYNEFTSYDFGWEIVMDEKQAYPEKWGNAMSYEFPDE